MELAILNKQSILFILRWIHFFAAIAWIGHLYYFNFVQGEFFKEVDANTKNIALQKLAPKALWWFRWGALFTWVSGFSLIMGTMHMGMQPNIHSSWAINIFIGSGLGTLMFLNVWGIIWPAQKVMIASANQVLSGGQPIPEAAARGARALVASRTNVMFSIPMLFFMGAAQHLGLIRDFTQVNLTIVFGSIGAVLLLLEINAIKGKVGPMASIKGVLTSGFLLTVILYLMVELTTKNAVIPN